MKKILLLRLQMNGEKRGKRVLSQRKQFVVCDCESSYSQSSYDVVSTQN